MCVCKGEREETTKLRKCFLHQNKLGSTISPWLLLQFLPLGSWSAWVPAQTSLMDKLWLEHISQINTFLPKLLLVTVFIRAIECKLGHGSFQPEGMKNLDINIIAQCSHIMSLKEFKIKHHRWLREEDKQDSLSSTLLNSLHTIKLIRFLSLQIISKAQSMISINL